MALGISVIYGCAIGVWAQVSITVNARARVMLLQRGLGVLPDSPIWDLVGRFLLTVVSSFGTFQEAQSGLATSPKLYALMVGTFGTVRHVVNSSYICTRINW